jgi:hypothetical protein
MNSSFVPGFKKIDRSLALRMRYFYHSEEQRNVGWVERSATQQKNRDLLGFVSTQPNLQS